MRHATLVLILCVTLTAEAALAFSSRSGEGDRVERLLDQLASSRFAERDRAMKELEALGPTALPALRLALKSPDAEVRQRVELLVRKLENQELAAKLLTARKVRLNVKDVTVAEAVAELARLTGYPIHLVVEPAGRKVTLDTGETTFWDAVDQLAQQAGLMETTTSVLRPGTKGVGKGQAKGTIQRINPVPDHGVILTAGEAPAVPTVQAGSIRIRLIKVTPVGGDVDITFEVAGEPCLVGLAAAGLPRIDKCLDEKDHRLASVLPPVDKTAKADDYGDVVRGAVANAAVGVVKINGQVISNGPTVPQPTGPFEVTVRLRRGDKSAKTLQELSGRIGLLTMVDAGPLAVVDKILTAKGQSVKAKDGSTVTVKTVERLKNGDVRIQVTMSDLPGVNPLGAGGGIVIQGGGNVVINGNNVAIGGGGSNGPSSPLKLLDAKGEAFTQIDSAFNGTTIAPGQMSQTMTLLFRPRAGQAEAAQLVLPGQRSFGFEVPFTFKDVVLP
jgi:hypothetical protein